MDLERSRQAADNNACWCDAVCRAHGGETRFGAAAWFNRRASPPFYPNLVTLDPHAKGLPALAALPMDGVVAIKDSFARFDLSDLGFSPLFDAQWVWREPRAAAGPAATLRWSVAHDDESLADWEARWWTTAQDGPPTLRLYPPALLAEPGLHFLLGRGGDGAPCAGAALLQGHGVAGLACIFHPGGGEGAAAYAELLQAAQRLCPEAPLVGYESGEALRLAVEAGGFTPVGPLRVWIRADPCAASGAGPQGDRPSGGGPSAAQA